MSIKLPETDGFREGDHIHLIDNHGAIIDQGTLLRIDECPESYSHKIFNVDGREHRLNFRHYEDNPTLYAIPSSDLKAGAFHAIKAKLNICDSLISFVGNLDLSAEQLARFSELSDALHQEVLKCLSDSEGKLKPIHKTFCEMHGYYDIFPKDIAQNIQLTLAVERRSLLLKKNRR